MIPLTYPYDRLSDAFKHVGACWLTRCDNVDDENDGREPFRYRRGVDESLLVPRHVISTQQAREV